MKPILKYLSVTVLLFSALTTFSQDKTKQFIAGKVHHIYDNIIEIKDIEPIIGSLKYNKIKINVPDKLLNKILTKNPKQYYNKNVLVYIKVQNNKFFICEYKDTLKFQKPYLTPTKEPIVILDTVFFKGIKYDLKKMNYELKTFSESLNYNIKDKLSFLASVIYGKYNTRKEQFYYDFIREYAIWEYYEESNKHYCYDKLLYGRFYRIRNSEIPLKLSYIIDKLLSPPFHYKSKETISLYLKFIDSEEKYLTTYGEKKLKEALVFFKKNIKTNEKILKKLSNL